MSEKEDDFNTVYLVGLSGMVITFLILVFLSMITVYNDNHSGINEVNAYLTEEYLEELSNRKIVSINHLGDISSIRIKEGRSVDFISAVKIGLPYGVLVVEDYQVKYKDKTKSCSDVVESYKECVKRNAEKFIKLSLISLDKRIEEYKELTENDKAIFN